MLYSRAERMKARLFLWCMLIRIKEERGKDDAVSLKKLNSLRYSLANQVLGMGFKRSSLAWCTDGSLSITLCTSIQK